MLTTIPIVFAYGGDPVSDVTSAGKPEASEVMGGCKDADLAIAMTRLRGANLSGANLRDAARK